MPDEPAGDQVAELTRRAAIDGLSLETVFADLRRLLGLASGEDLPPALVRECAVTWARTSEELTPAGIATAAGRDDVEDLVWPVLASCPVADAPLLLVVTAAPAPDHPSAVMRVLGGTAGLLHLVADLVASDLDPVDEIVLRWGGTGRETAVVAVLRGPDGAARVAALDRQMEDLASGHPLQVTAVVLDDHPGGRLAAVRQTFDACAAGG